MRGLRQYEKDEHLNILKLRDDIYRLCNTMGGRDNRPERVALRRSAAILDREIQRSIKEMCNA